MPWFLGPSGYLRELPPMDRDVKMPKVRYGGVHQGMSGARTYDVTGFRDDYEFSFALLTQEELRWMHLLHTRHIPGPFWLINPMKRNRLSTRATSLDRPYKTNAGINVSAGDVKMVRNWPAAAGPGLMSAQWENRAAINTETHFDRRYRVPVFPAETVTASIYLRAAEATTVNLLLWGANAAGSIYHSHSSAAAVTTEWQRFTLTATPTEEKATVQFSIQATDASTAINFAAPQLESGSEATPWEEGGGAPLVHIDQLDHESPIMGVHRASLVLAEA